MSKSFRYIKVHEDMPDHPKVAPLSDGAFRELIDGWCWSRKYGTDGLMPLGVWNRRRTARIRSELVTAGLVHVEENGARYHDWLDWQSSVDELDSARQQRVNAGRAGGLAKSKRAASEPLSESASGSLPDLELEEEKSSTKTSARKRAIAPDWLPSEADLEWAKTEAGLVNVERETASFVDYWLERGVKRGDWSLTWRPWMRRAQDNAEKRAPLRALPGGERVLTVEQIRGRRL